MTIFALRRMSTTRVLDKSWLTKDTFSDEFCNGLTVFTEYALAKLQGFYREGYLPCPCKCCVNTLF